MKFPVDVFWLALQSRKRNLINFQMMINFILQKCFDLKKGSDEKEVSQNDTIGSFMEDNGIIGIDLKISFIIFLYFFIILGAEFFRRVRPEFL